MIECLLDFCDMMLLLVNIPYIFFVNKKLKMEFWKL